MEQRAWLIYVDLSLVVHRRIVPSQFLTLLKLGCTLNAKDRRELKHLDTKRKDGSSVGQSVLSLKTGVAREDYNNYGDYNDSDMLL